MVWRLVVEKQATLRDLDGDEAIYCLNDVHKHNAVLDGVAAIKEAAMPKPSKGAK